MRSVRPIAVANRQPLDHDDVQPAPVKHITCGEGACDDDDSRLAARCACSGIMASPPTTGSGKREGSWQYQMVELGSTAPHDLQCVLAESQLEKASRLGWQGGGDCRGYTRAFGRRPEIMSATLADRRSAGIST